MTRSRRQNLSSPLANKPRHCCKVKCHRSLPLNHPTSYTNGLCERHFFLIDLPSNDNDDDDDRDNYLTNESNEKQIQQTKKQYEPIRGDRRIIREVFDGRQWLIFEEIIDHETSTTNNDNASVMTMKDSNEPLVQIFRLLSSYQTMMDELKEKQSI